MVIEYLKMAIRITSDRRYLLLLTKIGRLCSSASCFSTNPAEAIKARPVLHQTWSSVSKKEKILWIFYNCDNWMNIAKLIYNTSVVSTFMFPNCKKWKNRNAYLLVEMQVKVISSVKENISSMDFDTEKKLNSI